jgi:hypothetical protein
VETRTLEGAALYNEELREIVWQGTIDPGKAFDIVYKARPVDNLENGAKIVNKVEIMDANDEIGFWRTTSFWINAPDFSHAILNIDPVETLPNKVVDIQVLVPNTGQVASVMSATVFLPPGSDLVSGSLIAIDGMSSDDDGKISWDANLAPGETASLRFQLRTEMIAQPLNLPVTIMIEDGVTDPVFRQSYLKVVPDHSFFPWVYFGKH